MHLEDYISHLEKEGHPRERIAGSAEHLFHANAGKIDLNNFSTLVEHLPVLENTLNPAVLSEALHSNIQSIQNRIFIARDALRHLDLLKKYLPLENIRCLFRSLCTDKHDLEERMTAFEVAHGFHKLLDIFHDDPEIIDHIASFICRYKALLPLLSFTPPSQLPQAVLQDRTYQTIMSLPPKITNTVHAIRETDIFTGMCQLAEERYMRVLNSDTHHYGRYAVVQDHEGDAFGMVKFTGCMSLLGLRNLRAEDGTYPIVRGGIYGMNAKDFDEFLPYKKEERKFVHLHRVSPFPLRPLRLIGAPTESPDILDSRERQTGDYLRLLEDFVLQVPENEKIHASA